MIGKRVEDRIEFDEDTRRKILKKTNFCCAACGQKLDLIKHTVDHIIPISRGGTNDIDNLLGLCKMCNEYKGNLIYYPYDYYTYLTFTNPRAVRDMHDAVVEFLKSEVQNIDLHRYPLISPCSTVSVCPKGIKPKGYIRQFMFDVVYMYNDMRRANASRVRFLRDYPYYAIIKRTTQKLDVIIRVDYTTVDRPEDRSSGPIYQLTLFNEWSDCSYRSIAQMMLCVANSIATKYMELGIPLDEVCIASTNDKIADTLYNSDVGYSFGRPGEPYYYGVASGELHDREDLGEISYYYIELSRDLSKEDKDENKE